VTRRQREGIERHHRRQHDRTCTGLRLSGYLTTIEGQTLRVLDGTPCSECAKGRWMAERGPEGIERAIEDAARRRGPTWITRAELARKYFNGAGLPLWGGIQVEP
jgi:hypothetical protein